MRNCTPLRPYSRRMLGPYGDPKVGGGTLALNLYPAGFEDLCATKGGLCAIAFLDGTQKDRLEDQLKVPSYFLLAAEDSGFRVQAEGAGFRVQGEGAGFRVWGLGFGVWG